MRLIAALAAVGLAAVLAVAPARAYTPESGIWLNPNELGTAMIIEIQDNLMVLSAYMGDAQGKSTWYTAAGILGPDMVFEGDLAITEGSQCVGCPYLGPPTVHYGAAGHVKIEFDPNDETKAKLTWGNGRVVQIQRYKFYLRRDQDGATPIDITKMLGEWQVVLDMSTNPAAEYPYFGDVVVFDVFERDNGADTWFYEGCRADDSLVGGCSDAALRDHSAAGFYVPSTDVQCVVVDDSASTYVLYAVRAGTNHVRGEATLYVKGQNPLSYVQYPVRGFRSASRTFVQTGEGPGKSAAERRGLGDAIVPTAAAPATAAAKAWGDLTESCALDTPAMKRAEAQLAAKRLAH